MQTPNGMIRVKETTIYDIADELKISTATVSRALKDDPAVSPKTKKRIMDLVEKIGYRSNHIARSLRQQQTNTIGFMVHELQSTFINSVLAGVEMVTAQAGYDLIIAHSLDSYAREAANAKNMFHKRVAGLITSLSSDTKDLAHFRPFMDKKTPVVFFDRVERTSSDTVVVIDNYKCGYQATEHLIEQGCKKIALVTSCLSRNVYADRYRGYCDALRAHCMKVDENLLIINDLSEQAGIAAAHKILDIHPKPDGAFITNDFVAAVCMRTLKGTNFRIPEDIAIVGFNNDAISKLVEPALTTIQYPGKEMGRIAATTLLDQLNGVNNSRLINTVVISSELIVRESSLKKG